MGSQTILTPIQRQFLELFKSEEYLTTNYYWTGGTVLSEVYLHHRLSEDIDLFSEKSEVDFDGIKNFISISGGRLGSVGISYTRYLGLHTFIYKFTDGYQLKIDFNYYPFPRINNNHKWQGINIDSIEDIAVNKVHTISVKPRSRDYIDLYFLLKNTEYEFSVPRLIKQAKAKFDWDINPLQFGENLAKSITFFDLPHMLVPFDKKQMDNFYLDLAKSMEKDIFKS